MSLDSKKELVVRMREQYAKSTTRKSKQQILDMLIAATDYKRKYAISLLNSSRSYNTRQIRNKKNTYGQNIKNALLTIWNASNRICSKRLVPFIPNMIEVLERNEHMQLTKEIKNKLCSISAATVDRLLKEEKNTIRKRSMNATKSGQLLKNQIKVRTFSDWNDIVPGFIETDLVAHCGGNPAGSFINTLTLTDIDSTWTECLPLLYRSAENVIKSLFTTMQLLPFKILGIDVDNGSEFINHALIKFCEDNSITFTRSRPYQKNDQAHVEERNGSIVRKLVGYDRFEGTQSWKALIELYAVVRLYVNFFQPSLKLLSKSRDGAKVTKKYDVAKTPHQRLLESTHTTLEVKETLNSQYQVLDPVFLLTQMKEKQQALWRLGFNVDLNTLDKTDVLASDQNFVLNDKIVAIDKYKNNKLGFKKHPKRIYRTRPDPFEGIHEEIELRLQMDPNLSATELLKELIGNYPDQIFEKNKRTLQRLVATWKKKHLIHELVDQAEAVDQSNAEGKFIKKVLKGVIK